MEVRLARLNLKCRIIVVILALIWEICPRNVNKPEIWEILKFDQIWAILEMLVINFKICPSQFISSTILEIVKLKFGFGIIGDEECHNRFKLVWNHFLLFKLQSLFLIWNGMLALLYGGYQILRAL